MRLASSSGRGHRLVIGCAITLYGCNAIAGIETPNDKTEDAATYDARDDGAGGAAMEASASADRRNDEPIPRPDADAATMCALSMQSIPDPTTGITWTPVWYCGNRGGAPIFETASARTQVGRMRTTMSWFACYRHGDPHTGGNDVWYYTQGDEILPGWESRHAWGYMAAVDVYTLTDPFPGIGACP